MSFSKHKQESDFSGSYWINDDDGYNKYKKAESTALKTRKELLEDVDHNKGYFAINLNIDAFKSPIYLLPGINMKLKTHKAEDLFSDE